MYRESVLFLGIIHLYAFSLGGDLISFVTIVSFAWTFGLIQELLFFKKRYEQRVQGTDFGRKEMHYHLLTKLGFAIVTSYLIASVPLLLKMLTHSYQDVLHGLLYFDGFSWIEISLTMAAGLFLGFTYRNKLSK